MDRRALDVSVAAGLVLLLLVRWAATETVPAPEIILSDGNSQPVRIKLDPYMELCRGTYEQPAAVSSALYCWYDVRNDYATIGPRKVEVLNNDPFIVVFHDAVYDSEIAHLQALGESTIKVSGPTNDSWMPVFYDDHQTYSLHDRDHPVVQRITKRVELLSGLSCDTAEDLKVIYNEIGSFKTSMIDAIQSKEEMQRFAYSGDRLATALFFLNDVEKGSFTIFPKLRVTIRPQKGMMAFWYNLKETGEAEPLMKYSICPLEQGTKWTAKKHIHTRGNELRKPCRAREP